MKCPTRSPKACLLLIAVILTVWSGPSASASAKSSMPRELEVLRYAQNIYDQITGEFDADSYQTQINHELEGFTSKLNNAKQFSAIYNFHTNIASTLISLELGLLMEDPRKIANAAASAGLDVLMKDVMNIKIDMSLEDFVFSQATSAAKSVARWDIYDTMKRAQENGGRFASYEDAKLFLRRYLENRMNISTLRMAAGYYEHLMNRNVRETFGDLFARVAVSDLAGKLGGGDFLAGYASGKLSNMLYSFLDIIGQQVNEKYVSEWIDTQKQLVGEIESYFPQSASGLDLSSGLIPKRFARYAGNWACDTEGAPSLTIEKNNDQYFISLYHPAQDRLDRYVSGGVTATGKICFLNADNASILTLKLLGAELSVQTDTCEKGREERSLEIYHWQEYGWAAHWVNTENPETVLDITSNGNGTLHLAAHFAPDLSFAFDFPPVDYELLYFDTLDDPFPADMRIDGTTGMLEFNLYTDSDSGLLDTGSQLYERIGKYGGAYFFTTENPPDLTRFGWIPYDEPATLSEEEALQLFSRLSETPLMAASGAGAWEGRLKINADGTFNGIYQDSDADMIYESSFFGSFSHNVEKHGKTFRLWVEKMTTRQAPGTHGTDKYGDPVTYTDPPFCDQEYMVLTLPGTPGSEIPEAVQGEIGGTLDEWEDYSRFITLTRLNDGWGFFADPADPPAYDLEPVAADAPAATEVPAPAAAPASPENLPKNVTRMPGGNLRYDNGLIAFEMPDNGMIMNSRDVMMSWFPENTSSDVVNICIPSPADHRNIHDFVLTETQVPYFHAVQVGIAQLPKGADAAGLVWTFDTGKKESGYMTIAGRTAKYEIFTAGPDMPVTSYGSRDYDVYSTYYAFMPLSGSRILWLNYSDYHDAGRKEALELFLETLEIRDSLYAKPPEDTVQTMPPTPLPTPTALPDLPNASLPEDQEETDPWLGSWIARQDGHISRMQIEPGDQSDYAVVISFDESFSFSGQLQENGDGTLDVLLDDYIGEFNALMTLDRESHAITVSEIGCMADEINDLLDAFHFILVYRRESGNSVPTAVPATVTQPAKSPAATEVPPMDSVDPSLLPPLDRIVTMGTYPQGLSGTDQSPIEWIVLDEQDGKTLLITRDIVDVKPIRNSEFGLVTWETSYQRTWLNSVFFNRAFTAREQAAIQVTNVSNDKSQGCTYSADGGNDTQDRLFSLSWAEAYRYFAVTEDNYKNTRARAHTSVYQQRFHGGYIDWWLRSPGYYQVSAMAVGHLGELCCLDASYPGVGVRPAMWVDLSMLETGEAPQPAEPPAAPGLSGSLTGYWMTRDDSLAEMIITDNGNGTLHAKAMFLPAGDSEATLTPRADGSILFEDQYGYLIGLMTVRQDGGLHLTFTGGSTMEDEEATEYQGYYARGFTYYPASYEEMWYQTPEDAAATEDDWTGTWRMMGGKEDSGLTISRVNGGLRVDVSMGRYRFSGMADLAGDSIMALYDDDFNCLLLLNRKLNRIAMMEVGSTLDEVYDWVGNAYYGVVIYHREDHHIDVPDGLRRDDLPPVSVLPVPTAPGTTQMIMDLPISTPVPDPVSAVGLLPIPGKPGRMQVPVSRVDATSYIVGKDPSAYAPERMIDGEETTSFQFSTKTTKLGREYLYFEFSSPAALDELWMKNGFWKNTDGKDQYTRNSRVKKMTIFVRYAGSNDYQLLRNVTLKDDSARKDWKVIDMPGLQNVTAVRIRIDSIYAGSKYKTDVCISEIMFVWNAEH